MTIHAMSPDYGSQYALKLLVRGGITCLVPNIQILRQGVAPRHARAVIRHLDDVVQPREVDILARHRGRH